MANYCVLFEKVPVRKSVSVGVNVIPSRGLLITCSSVHSGLSCLNSEKVHFASQVCTRLNYSLNCSKRMKEYYMRLTICEHDNVGIQRLLALYQLRRQLCAYLYLLG